MKIKASTQAKMVKLLASLNTKTAATISAYLNGEEEAVSTKATLDGVAKEIQKLYAAVKGLTSSSKEAFIASTQDQTIDSIFSDLAVIATRIDLAARMIEAETFEEEIEEEDVTTDDVLDELGVDTELEDGEDEEVEIDEEAEVEPELDEEIETEASVETEASDDIETEASEEESEDEEDESEEGELDEGIFEEPELEDELEDEVVASTAKTAQKIKATRKVVSKNKSAASPLAGLFNFK